MAVGLAVAVGLYLRARADYVSGLHERATRLERERELLADQAVADERVRIARELHDVVAHNVSLMVVQAQALAATGAAAATSSAALGRVADLGREALSEMHRMLGVLRLQNGAARRTRAAARACDDLDALIARTREAGLDASLMVEGPAARAAARRRPIGVPDRPGGAHERDPACAAHARDGDAARTRRRRAGGDRRSTTESAHRPADASTNGHPAGTGSSGCASGWRCSAASSRPGRAGDGTATASTPSLPVQ